MIRITGGTNRSRLLKTPLTDETKPTMDKVRLGVFSALGERVINANVLDLFAGSGSYGFESLSRGASSASFVDVGNEPIKCIKDNARALNVNVNIYQLDVMSFLNNVEDKFDIIFIDPPYKLDTYKKMVDLIINKDILTKNGIIVLESERELLLDESKFAKVKFYKYGLAKVYILRR